MNTKMSKVSEHLITISELNEYNVFVLIAIDYTFGLFTGILMTSTFYFVTYAIYKRNKPVLYPKIILPGLVSGIMWGIATSKKNDM